MGDRALENRIRKIRELEAQKKELEKQISSLKDEIRKDMTDRNEEEHQTPHFTIRYKHISSSSFNSKKFKVENPEMYNAYLVTGHTMRLTIS